MKNGCKTATVISPPEERPTRRKRLKACSFFAGIGGFDLGFQRAGIPPVFHCEIQPFCNAVLKKHWPKAAAIADINAIKPADVPEADVWCGGFPCQDVSVARGWLGREGLKGHRTGLFFPFAKLVESRQPVVVVMENVTGLLNSHGGRDFAILLATLDALGYGVAWRTLNTRYFGAPQSRPRVYICAWRGEPAKALRVLFERGPTRQPEKPRLGFLRDTRCGATGARVPEVAFCLAATSGRHTGTDWSRSYVAYHSEVRRLTPNECERIQGFPTNWTLPPQDSKLDPEDLDSLRYHAIGNAVSVPVVEWVAQRVMSEFQQYAPEMPKTSLFDSGLEGYGAYCSDFASMKAVIRPVRAFASRDEFPSVKWGSGGVMHDGVSLSTSVSASPNRPVESRFVEILDAHKPDARYFLSPNAARGILRRVQGQGRELFKPLDEALARLGRKLAS